jgi:DNA-binding response OmpR family regulator
MSLKVLTIDDDPSMTELLGLLLRSYKMEVVVANDSNIGLGLARTEKPDLITLDLMMPGLDGWQICKEIRSFSQVPIIIISALDNPAAVASALDSGASDYMVKPVPGKKLVQRINELAGGSAE